MKTFYRNDGPSLINGYDFTETTLTVGEMKEILSKLPDDMPVLAAWEGLRTCFGNDTSEAGYEDYRVETTSPACWLEECECLVFDVDER